MEQPKVAKWFTFGQSFCLLIIIIIQTRKPEITNNFIEDQFRRTTKENSFFFQDYMNGIEWLYILINDYHQAMKVAKPSSAILEYRMLDISNLLIW